MRQQKSDALIKQPLKAPFTEDDENRIDWERKTLKKVRREDEEPIIEEVITQVDDDPLPQLEAQPRRPKKDKRDKRRQLVMDEESGRVFVKRRRKRHQYDDWSDDYE
ncbi:MAG TPA: hypothetical protein VHL11_10910 [Phototrophicaceae bacterium]|jgi:hypothetical protein|nr:hypothetical protein [Phototrophicaceae bacterium]